MDWSLVIDISVAVVLGVFALIGFCKGFLNTLLSLFGNLASLAIAIVIVKPCKDFLNGIFHIVDWLGGLITNGLSGVISTVESLFTGEAVNGTAIIQEFNNHGWLGKFSALFVNKETAYESFESLTVALKNTMGGFAATVFTVIVMFILIKIAVLILSKIFNAITKKRALSGLDRLLGLVLGALKGAVVIVTVLSVITTLGGIFPVLDELIAHTTFTNWIYGHTQNLMQWIINSIDLTSLISLA